MQNAILLACGLMLIGVMLRAKLRFLAAIYLPAALVAGVIALAFAHIISQVTRRYVEADGVNALAGLFSAAHTEWTSWRNALIPVIFAGLLLQNPGGSAKENLRETAQQGIAAWILILGQLALGLLVTWLFLSPAFGVPIHFGQLLEVSWAGGFGSSGAWGVQHERLGVFNGAGDLAVFFTTIGLIYGVLSGVVLVNIAIRRGWTAQPFTGTAADVSDSRPAGRNPIARDVIDPLMFQILLLAMAFAAGVLLQRGVAWVVSSAAPDTAISKLADELPLFVFTLLGGYIVRRFLVTIGRGGLIDNESMHRLTGVALELLIFVAVATLQVRTIRDNWLPMAILMAVGAAWVAFNVLWISPRILPRNCWFELAIMNHGFATATTAQGMMLLRMIDRDLRTDAAKIYAIAAPLTAMFIGGGIVTYTMPYMLTKISALWIVLGASCASGVLFVVGRRVAKAEA